jgi:rod shape-determining protein MreC
MEPFLIRYRNILVLLVMLVAQILGLAVQVRRTAAGGNTLDPADGGGVRLIRLWADTLVSGPERIIHGCRMGVVGGWQNYFALRHTREQNLELQKTVDRLRLEQAALLEDAKQGQRLQAILGFQQKYIYSTVAAQVFGSSGTDQSRVFYIDKGSADKLERDMAVITADGIVGKVREVFPHSAQVLAINDPTSGAGVILENTRIRGILRGNAAGEVEIVNLLKDQRIKEGEPVLTAGGDQIFPRGLPVGVVDRVVTDPERDSFIFVMVKPAARLYSLDEVLVITDTQPRFSPQQQQDLATSQNLKGAEAEALNEQKKASAIMAERLPGLIDPNLPADKQPLNDSSLPAMPTRPPLPLHPDQFTPGSADQPPPAAKTVKPTPTEPGAAPDGSTKPAAKPAPKSQKPQPAPTTAAPDAKSPATTKPEGTP